ncbi:MAG: CvpA family protein [Chloroflexi bacterium]|nr:CvpA family protein [Chloroflexota bacterium]
MNWLDIGILALLALAVIQGLRAGFVRTLFTLGGSVLGVVMAGQFADAVTPALAPVLGGGNTSRIAAFVLLFLAVFVVASLLGNLVRHILSLTLLGWLDTLVGGFLGLVLGVVSTGFLLIALGKFPILGAEGAVRISRLAPLLISNVPLVLGLLPSDFGAVQKLFQ